MAEISTPVPPAVEVEDFAFQHSSPHSLRQPFSSPPAPPLNHPLPNAHDYNCSPELYDESTSASDTDDNVPNVNDESCLFEDDRRNSGISSVSSFPASVSRNATPIEPLRTPLRVSKSMTESTSRVGSTSSKNFSPRAAREYNAAFRNPSSVLAMQMKDEDLEYIIPSHRRSGSHYSNRSQRSSYSLQNSPTKQFGRSSQSSPQKSSKLRKEFPLVLLHCNLLPPAGNFNAGGCDADLLAALLPEEYRKRWILLQDSLAGTEVKTRGILIPHPQEDYEMLEERLLESLELEKPRIRQSHYFKHNPSGGDSGFESSSQTEEDTDSDVPGGVKCYDCGRKLRGDEDVDRKWEIKVYAANGLMRAGAWGAAWREMEKVDVEIGLWLPEDVRRDVNTKLEALETSKLNATSYPHADMEEPEAEYEMGDREREIYGHSSRARPQEEIDGFVDEAESFRPGSIRHDVHKPVKPDLPVILLNYVKLLLEDRRNVVILVLSMLVLVSAILGGSNGGEKLAATSVQQSSSVEVLTTTITSTAVWTATTTTTTTTTGQVVETPFSSSVAVEGPETSHDNVVEIVVAEFEKVNDMLLDSNPPPVVEEG